MKISEIFYSIQGEIFIGKPSIFVRVAGCNLKCTIESEGFLCDSKYAWKGLTMSIEDVIDKIKSFPCKHIVWTGGSPDHQQTDIKKIIEILGKDYTHSLESNGTINFDQRYFRGGVMVISPKKQKIVMSQLKKYASINKCYFKFVVKNHTDFVFWLDIARMLKLPNHRIYMMPCGTTAENLSNITLNLIEDCKKEGVMFTPRLHVMIWGNKRGK